ncbi:hypothetical protein D6C76_01041 [Aureobasidium pullulans]|nr:hypothetical protein D6C76_01041 [Aureobasidium pullulans]
MDSPRPSYHLTGFPLVQTSSEFWDPVPAALPDLTFPLFAEQCKTVWWSMASKLKRDLSTTNVYLVPDVKVIEKRLRAMSDIASVLPSLPGTLEWPSCYGPYSPQPGAQPVYTSKSLVSIQCIKTQCDQTIKKVRDVIDNTTEWSLVPKFTHDRLRACSDELLRQQMDLSIMAGAMNLSLGLDEDKESHGVDSFFRVSHDMKGWLVVRQSLQQRLAAWQTAMNTDVSTTKVSACNVEDWSSTQSSTGIMTPAESWCDSGSVASDATETGRTHSAIATKNNAEACRNLATRFVQSMDDLLELSKTADAEVVATCSNFVQDKCEQLAHDLKQSSQTLAPEHVKSSQLWPSTLQKDDDTINTEFANNRDKALDAIISGFSPKTVKEDIAKLVFLWVDVLEFAGFERDDVMKVW